jgi:prepilin-type processing-associated H-X9-DG protein
LLDERGRVYSWASLLQEHMPERRSFTCPSAQPAENVPTQHPTDSAKSLATSYGVYVPMALRQRSFIANPSQTVLISETSNRGANDTFDPVPLPGRGGGPAPVSGFVIAYDDGNQRHTNETAFVTRLAFPGSAGGKFEREGRSRHRNGIHALFADGRLGILTPPMARVEHLSPELTGLWQTR